MRRRGAQLEPVARQLYLLNEFDAKVVEVGLIDHPSIKDFAASPDGLVNEEGLIEIKCSPTHGHTCKPLKQAGHNRVMCYKCRLK